MSEIKVSVIVMYYVAKRDCPEGDWQPTIHTRNHASLKDGEYLIWAVSAWPNPFMGGNVSGFPGGTLDNAMPGAWIADPQQEVVATKESVKAEKEEHDDMVTIRLIRLG
jgi:hypothetical protein